MRRLTTHQHNILRLAAQGYTDRAIAAALCLTQEAIRQQWSRLYDRLGIPDDDRRARVLAWYRRETAYDTVDEIQDSAFQAWRRAR